MVSAHGPPLQELSVLSEPTEAVYPNTLCADKLQKFTPIWVKKCVLLLILLLWVLVNTSSAFTLPPAFGIL